MVSFGHCIICPSIYGFWLPLWYLLAIVLSVLQYTVSGYPYGIFWPLYYLSFNIRFLVTPLVSFGHCIICPSIYGFWLPLWYILAIVLSVLQYTFLVTPLVSFGHCIICPSIYGFWLPLWYLLAIVLSVLQYTVSGYPFGIFWPLYYLSFNIRFLVTPLVSFGHCIICPSIYGFWLPLWYLLAIVLSVLQYTVSGYPFGIFWPLYYLSFNIRFLVTPLVSFGHRIICPSIYGFWLPLWYLLAIVLSVLQYTVSGYPYSIFWPLYYLSFNLRFLVTPMVSFGHCIICPSIYGFWLPLWYLLAIVLSVLQFTVSGYPFGIFWPLYYLSFNIRFLVTPMVSLAIVLSVLQYTVSGYPYGIFWPLYYLSFNIRFLVTPMVSFGHCIICPSIYGFWLPLWYLLAIVLSVLQYTVSGYPYGIFWPLYYLSFNIRFLVTPLVSFGHCIICPSIYGFWLPLWYILAIVLSVLQYTFLVTPLVSFGHCIICPSIYGFWLPLWYILAIVLSVLQYTVSGYPFGIFWLLYYLSFNIRFLVTPLVSFGHCIICPSIYGFWLPLWYLLAIVLSVLQYTVSGYPFGIFWPLYYLSFNIRFLVTPLVSFGHRIICPSIYGFWLPLWYLLAIVLSVLQYTVSGYLYGILWPLYCLSFNIRFLVTPMVSFGHCIICPSIYGFWLPLWYTLAIVLSVLQYTVSGYPYGIFWPLYYLSFNIRFLVTPIVSFGHCIICPSIYGFWLPLWYLLAIVLSVLQYTVSGYPYGIFWPLYYLSFNLRFLVTPMVSFSHCIICPSIYGFWLPLWYLLAIVLSVLQYTVSGYPYGIFWPLYYLSFNIRFLVTPMVSFGHCIICPSIYGFWLPLWYLLAIVLSVLQYTVSGYPYGIFWPLYYLSFNIRFLVTPMVSFGHCIICPSIYGFWLPLWYLLAIVLSVLQYTVSGYPYGIFWPLYYLSFNIRFLVTPMVYFGHCIICPSIYGFWLPLWYLLAIVLSVLQYTVSGYPYGIFWPLYYLSFNIRFLVTPMVSFGHCIICPSIYGFWLPLWYLLAIVLSVLQYTVSGYLYGIFWPLYYLSFNIRFLVTPMVSFGHCIICPSIYGFWLPLWYLLAIVLSVLQYTVSGYPYGIFKHFLTKHQGVVVDVVAW